MNTTKRDRYTIQVTSQITTYLANNRVHPREPYYGVLTRLLGLSGKEKEAEVSGASASSNSEGSI